MNPPGVYMCSPFWTVVLEKTFESALVCKEIQSIHPKGDQYWVFIGRTDAEAETPILWPPNANSWLIGKDPDAGRDWGQEEKGTTEDEMAGWPSSHQLNAHEFAWTPGLDGQGSLACWDSWGHKESDMTERLKWTELNWGPHYAFLRVCVNYYNCNKSCLGTCFSRLILLITHNSVFCPETLPETCSYWLILYWSYLRMYALGKDVVELLQNLRYPFYLFSAASW